MKMKAIASLFALVSLLCSVSYAEISDKLSKLASDKNFVSCQMWLELIPYLEDLQDFEIRNWFNTLNTFKLVKNKKDCEKFDDSVRWVKYTSQDLIIDNPLKDPLISSYFEERHITYTVEKLDQKAFRSRLEFLLAIRSLFDSEFKVLNESLTKFFKDNPLTSQDPVDRYQAFRAAAESKVLQIFYTRQKFELPLGDKDKFIEDEKARVRLSLALHDKRPDRLEIYRSMKPADFILRYTSELFWKLANRYFRNEYIVAEFAIQEFNSFLYKPDYQANIIANVLRSGGEHSADLSVDLNTDPQMLEKLAQNPDAPENEPFLRAAAAGVKMLAAAESLFWSSGSSSFIYHWLKHAERVKSIDFSESFYSKLTKQGPFFKRVFATILYPTQVLFRGPRDKSSSSKMLGSLFFCAPNEEHPGKWKRAIVNFVDLNHTFKLQDVSLTIKYAPVLATYQEDLSSCL